MQQTAYLGVTNLYKKLPYLGGICKLWYIPVQEVASMPGINPINQYLLSEPILHDGGQWRGPVPVPDAQLGLTETQKNDGPGTYYEIKLQAQNPGDAPQSRVNFDNMAYNKYIVVGKQRAGGFYIILGSIESPLDFDHIYNNGPGAAENAHTKISFTGESIHRGLVLADFGGDESGYIYPVGGETSNMNQTEIIYIVNEDSKTIDWNITRLNKFGVFPEIEVYLTDEGGYLYKAPVQPTIDAAPPYFTQMFLNFTGLENGFISIK